MKNFTDFQKQVKEATDEADPRIMNGAAIIDLEEFAARMSTALQPDLETILNSIEGRLNWHGYTLSVNTVDVDDESEEDTENFLIYPVAGKSEHVTNVYFTLSWEEMASGTIAPYGQRAASLHYKVKMTVNKAAPGEIDAMLSDMENETPDNTAAE